MPTPDHLDPVTDSGLLDGMRRENFRLLATIEAMRKVQDLRPVPGGNDLSDAEMARSLLLTLTTTVTRAEVVLSSSAEIVEQHTYELRRSNDIRLFEVELERQKRLDLAAAASAERDRQERKDKEKEGRKWGILQKFGNCFTTIGTGVGTWVSNIFAQKEVIGAATMLVVVLLGGLTAYVSGWFHIGQ